MALANVTPLEDRINSGGFVILGEDREYQMSSAPAPASTKSRVRKGATVAPAADSMSEIQHDLMGLAQSKDRSLVVVHAGLRLSLQAI